MAEGGGEQKAGGGTSAVFISYASQDVAAAARICGALRQAGVEVWFDQSELRGGDVWDRQIRQQVHDCRLFMPIVSANTEARVEGYFRREWKLAVDRTHDLSERVAFLVPIVIDATPEAKADVPDAFRHFQWTRLPNGDTPPAFTARIVALLRAPGAAASAANSAQSGMTTRPVVLPAATAKLTPRSRRAVIPLVGVAAVVLAYVVVDRFWLSKHTSAERPAAAVVPVPTPATSAIPEKSVAVLPFVDMSEKKDQEYFSDGLSEELIDMLTKVPGLRVPARTSSFYFKGKQATVPEIAKALGVADVLEGSVRKSGNRLRITAQLVRADNGYHLWSETYDRQLDDIFKVQDDIAGAVVKALKISLMGGFLPELAGTQNIAAYNLYLQATSMWRHASEPADFKRIAEYLRGAVDADPQYANAWALLSETLLGEAMPADAPLDHQLIEEARRIAKQALKLNSALPAPHLAYALILWNVDFDVRDAEAQIQQALELDPNSAQALRYAASASMFRGKFDRALELAQKSVAIDPVDPGAYDRLALIYYFAGKYPEALAALRKMLDLDPGTNREYHAVAAFILLAKGDAVAALSEIDSDKRVREGCSCLVLAYDALGRKAEADAALANLEKHHADDDAYEIGLVYASRSELDQAFGWFERAYRERQGELFNLKVSPFAKNVRSDPRLNVLLRKLGLLD